MQIKKPRDLTLRDLPNLESPSAAASQIGYLANRPGSPLTWDQSLVQDSPFARPLDQQTFVNRLREKLEKGELLMVYGVTDGRPFNPLVAWREGGSLPARWQVEKNIFGLNLEHKVDQLNDWQITPEQIDHLGPGGVGHLSASSFDSDLRAQKAEERAQAKQDQERRLSAPVGAVAAVAPLAIAAQESEEETKPEKKLHIEVGIFTDGTLNNAGNSDIFQEKIKEVCLDPFDKGEIDRNECERRFALIMGTSYANNKTNVAHLFDLYPESDELTNQERKISLRVYSAGAGSSTGNPDTIWGMASGMGETGVVEQVKRAFSDLADFIKVSTSDETLASLTIDLFGFSRGAAAARHAANQVAEGPEGDLGQAMSKRGLELPAHTKIRFIGLFDTVAGIVNPLNGDFSPSNASNEPLNIRLDRGIAERVVQLAAANEKRANFALNSLRAQDGALPSNFTEFVLPGAHSDIGGGYQKDEVERVVLSPTLDIEGSDARWPKQTMKWDNLALLQHQVSSESWLGEHSLELEKSAPPYIRIVENREPHPAPDGKVRIRLEMGRRIIGDYSGIGLRLMHSAAEQVNVPLKQLNTKNGIVPLPAELEPIYKSLRQQLEAGNSEAALDDSQLALVKQKYTHHSDHYNLFELASGSIRMEALFGESFHPFRPTNDGKRKIIPNV